MIGQQHRSSRQPGRWATLAFAACIVIGCALSQVRKDSARKTTLNFPHKLHVEGEGLDCSDCHQTAEEEDEAGLLAIDECSDMCHEAIDEEKPAEKRIASFLVNGEPQWQRRAALGGDLRFSHATHTKAKIECKLCHGDIAATMAISDEVVVDMDDCTACHLKRRVGTECSICHEEIRSDVMPATHGPAWTRLHGEIVRMERTDRRRYQCSLCHEESTCDSCHLAEEPTSHTALWRWQGHAVGAAFDRERCRTCHSTDSCIECHEITEPRSHTAAWARPPNYLHCSEGCHTSLSEGGCVVCHRSIGEHPSAPPLDSGFDQPPHPMPMGGALPCASCHDF